MIEDIENFREEQYADYSIYLGTTDVIELTKCNFCCEHVEESEIELFDMKEYNDAGTVEYCTPCIENYKEENK
jgi:hypothetical protein